MKAKSHKPRAPRRATAKPHIRLRKMSSIGRSAFGNVGSALAFPPAGAPGGLAGAAAPAPVAGPAPMGAPGALPGM